MSKRIKLLLIAIAGYTLIRLIVLAVVGYKLVSGGFYGEQLFRLFDKDTSTYSTVNKNVRIYTYPRHDMFSPSWWESPVSGEVSPLMEKDRERAINVLDFALSKYNESMLRENLENVYLLGELRFYNEGYGGTYYSGSVFMTVKSSLLGYSDTYIEKTFHHEFSSILLNKYRNNFDENKWTSANDPGFKYGTGGLDAIKHGNTSMSFDEECNKLGLLNEYSKASVEEDFNEMAGNMFVASREFWDVVDKYERVKKKILMLIDFYHRIDPIYTEEYFRKLIPI